MNNDTLKDFLKGAICIILLLMVSVVVLSYRSKKLSSQLDTAKGNITTLSTDLNTYKLKDSTNVAEILTLSLSKDEFLNLCSEQQEEIEKLNIKVKNLKQYSTTSDEYVKEIRTYLHDTLYINNGLIDTMKCFFYSDTWNVISGCIEKDSVVALNMVIEDTITQTLEQLYKHKFLWWQWGKNGIKSTIHHSNPNIKTVDAKIIQIN